VNSMHSQQHATTACMHKHAGRAPELPWTEAAENQSGQRAEERREDRRTPRRRMRGARDEASEPKG
jgi:hypothetical protein